MKAWISAFRLRTLPLAFSCIFMGAFLAYPEGDFDGVILTMSLLTTLFLQILSNLANDYGDATSGVDSEYREGPKRQVQSGKITRLAMRNALIIFSFLSFWSGVALVFYSFQDNWIQVVLFIGIGLGAIAAAIKYTVGKRPYGYAGFGDLFVLIFFGWVGVGGSYFLYTGQLQLDILLPATSCGLLAVGVLNVNNIRDINSDKLAGKKSIPVRIGRELAVYYHIALLATAFVLALIFAFHRSFQGFDWIFVGVALLFFKNAYSVATQKQAEQLDPYLKQLALSTLLFVLLFGFGLV